MPKTVLFSMALLLLTTLSQAKTGRSYYTDELLAQLKNKLETQTWARNQAQNLHKNWQWLADMPDEQLWEFVPPPEQLRAINVSIGHDCPNCGDEITRKAGHYPWLMYRDQPFKVKCPVCQEVFPKNDFQPWNTEGLEGKPETGETPTDRGVGWVDPKDERRYYFVSYYVFWQRWSKDVIAGLEGLSQTYLMTGDPAFAHKAAVMLARLASMYDRFDYPTQCYHEGVFGVRGRIMDYIWSTGNNSIIARAYDAIYPVFADDGELAAFLKGQGIDNPRQLIEQNMLQRMAKDIMTGYVSGNMGMHQRTMCQLALVLDNDDPQQGATTAEMRDWLMSGGGRVEDLLWNGFYRDGLGAESSPGYSSGWCTAFYEIARLLPRLGVNIWDNPRLKKMADIGLDLLVADQYTPSIGDTGSILGTGRVAWTPSLQGPAFMHYGDPRHAQALAKMGMTQYDLFDDLFDEAAVEAALQKHGREMTATSRNLGGYGLAVLEGGEGDSKYGLSLYYGDAAGGHGHYDRLNIEMFAFGQPMMPDDGYPTPFRRPDFFNWRAATVRHYAVLIDESRQLNMHKGHLHTFAVTPGVQLVDASAEGVYPGLASLYRRTTAMIPTTPGNFYLLDWYRVRGGSQHDWSFHGPAFSELSVTGGELGPVQKAGTLAGEEIEYGARPPRYVVPGETQIDLLSGQPLLPGNSSHGPDSLQGWAPLSGAVLTRKLDSPMTVTLPQPFPAGKARLWLSMYDYNEGENLVEINLGGTTAWSRLEPTGTVGYTWLEAELELPAEVTEVVLTAREMTQSFVQINGLFLTRHAGDTPPVLINRQDSGFHGLRNVRRMHPEGAWSASWVKAEDNVALTMTMPAGCASEVITADGEPELVPGSPRKVDYTLARNRLASGQSAVAEPLASCFVAAIEPHRNQPLIQQVVQLTGEIASPEASGVQVIREGAIDYTHTSLDPQRPISWQGAPRPFEVTGEFALVTMDEQGLQQACLINGTALAFGDHRLQVEPLPPLPVAEVDFAGNALIIDQPLSAPETLSQLVAIIGNDVHQTSYTVQSVSVEGGRSRIELGDVLFVVGMGTVARVDEAAGLVQSAESLTTYGRIEHNRHQGRWLYNDDKSQGFRIKEASSTTFTLEGAPADLSQVFNDRDGDGRALYWISDIGPGDLCRLPTITYLQRRGTGLYNLQTNAVAEFTLPRDN
jgi:endogenous inhibitor of DNA gyrase (YacG/DUF329 family)